MTMIMKMTPMMMIRGAIMATMTTTIQRKEAKKNGLREMKRKNLKRKKRMNQMKSLLLSHLPRIMEEFRQEGLPLRRLEPGRGEGRCLWTRKHPRVRLSLRRLDGRFGEGRNPEVKAPTNLDHPRLEGVRGRNPGALQCLLLLSHQIQQGL